MKVVLKVFVICSLLLSANAASAGVIAGGNPSVSASSGLDSAIVLYYAIFNSSVLNQYANQNAIITMDDQMETCLAANTASDMDNVSQECLNTFDASNLQLLTNGGETLRSCMLVTDQDLVSYFAIPDSSKLFAYFTGKMLHCSLKSSASKIMSCNVETITMSLSKLKSAVTPNYKEKKNPSCLTLGMQYIMDGSQGASNTLMNCLPMGNPCSAAPAAPVPNNNSDAVLNFDESSGSSETVTEVVNIPDIYYDAIFKSTALSAFANQNSIITLDNVTSVCLSANVMENADIATQSCLNSYAVTNVQLLLDGGAGLRSCMQVTDDNLSVYFTIPDSIRMYAYFTGEMAHCVTKSSMQKVIACNAETIAVSLGKVKSAVVPNSKIVKNKTCLSLELESMLSATQAATSQLMGCLPQSNPCNVGSQN